MTLAWAHPELHPTLWTTAIGAPMPADEGDARLGIGSAVVPLRAGSAVEVRLELGEIEHAARLGATAVLTLVAPDGDRGAKVSTTVVSFARGAAATRRYEVDAGALRER